jgi:hypothetical protein
MFARVVIFEPTMLATQMPSLHKEGTRVNGEGTAKSGRSVCRGAEDGTKRIDQQSKLGTISDPVQSRPQGEAPRP